MSQLRVTVIPNGPLKVQHCGSARFAGTALDLGDESYLCRCGDSANAPFCDGTHRRMGFDGGGPDESDVPLREWHGRTIRTTFDPATCMHVFHCKPLAGLREQELAGDDAAADEIARVIETCPSGALRYARTAAPAAGHEPMPDGAVALDIQAGGEVRVQVPFEIDAPRAAHLPTNRATLCRCGRSKNKPWCDGRHKGRAGFR
ncbi:MAG: CDGSH iron-sulfur domain-containing protein [Alphaproteobacteria bacterium]|nr:CDGSH iron-sulfur domain-containing protein [Alphaproteobacteria bacterium]